MDEVLIDAYLHQQTLGNKYGNSMTTSVMDSILKELKIHFPERPFYKEKIKYHMKHMKTKFNSCYDLFQNGLSGFGWDSTTNMWIAEDEVWNKLIEVLFTIVILPNYFYLISFSDSLFRLLWCRQNPKLLNGKTSQYYFMISWLNFLEKI